MSLVSAVLLSYGLLLTLLSAMSVHRLLLALAALRAKRVAPPSIGHWPTVLVQLPLYNERYVAERVIDAVCALDYPLERLTVQVLDDSTDVTTVIVDAAVHRWRARGIAIEHVRRGCRDGYKAGALGHGLLSSEAELVAIFDADFVPAPDFLRQLVPQFAEANVGMVQARWAHLNRGDSLLTEAQAILLDGHFANEHGGRSARGHFFNFNGTAGVWRRSCIDDAGGWSGETITEDLELSYRAQLRGWRFVYRPDVAVPAELPADSTAFKIQQHRWAKGSMETARLLLPRIMRARELPFAVRWEAALHLAGNLAYPLVLVLGLLMPFAVAARYTVTGIWLMALDTLFLVGSTGSLIFFYLSAERYTGDLRRALKHLPVVLAVGIGLAVNNTRAVFEVLLRRRSEFARTPKIGEMHHEQVARTYLPQAPWQAIIEMAFGLYLSVAVALAAVAGRYLAMPFLVLFASGFVLLGAGSLARPLAALWPRLWGKALTAPPRPKRI